MEQRVALSTITWNLATAGGGGDWDRGANWVGGNVPGPSDTAIIPKLRTTGAVYLNKNQSDVVGGLTTDSSVTFKVITGSLSFTAASTSTFGGPVTIITGASMSFGDGANLTIAAGQTLTVSGALTFNTGDQVSLTPDYQRPTRIVVSGTLTATTSSFTASNSYSSSLLLNVTGHLIASNCTFSLTQVVLDTNYLKSGDLIGNVFANNTTLVVPYRWVKYLTQNTSFYDIAINPNTIFSGTLALDAIGTDTTNLRYVFPGGFTIAGSATVNVGPNVTVVIPSNQTLTVSGSLNFNTGDQVSLTPDTQQPSQIIVGGTLSATGSSFTASNSDYSAILVNSGGNLQAYNCPFNLSNITLGSGASATMSADRLGNSTTTTQLAIDSNTTITIKGNDFSYVGTNGVIATGDASAIFSLRTTTGEPATPERSTT